LCLSAWLWVLLGGLASLWADNPAPVVLTVVPDHADGIYALNEKVTWNVDVKTGDRAGLSALPYVVRRDGAHSVDRGTLDLSTGPAVITASLSEPGTLLAVISSPGPATKKPLALGGAAVDPAEIAPAAPAPADFEAFWQDKLKELDAIPINPVVTKQNADSVGGIEYDKVTLDNIRGTHVQGQLARPQAGDKFPAMLILQYAGVYPLQKSVVMGPAKQGWLVLDINAHDLPIDAPAEFYKDQAANALKDYTHIGDEDRETSYFLRMVLGCVRAAEYLVSRPDWDGRILVATGTSQGGFQSLAAAALFPRITQIMVLVPAGCDVYAPQAASPRAESWPRWLSVDPSADKSKVEKTAGYYDPINFAARIHCLALVAAGLIDETAHPTGVIAAFNAIPAPTPKELILMPFSNHRGEGGTQQAFAVQAEAWTAALLSGTPLPMKPTQTAH